MFCDEEGGQSYKECSWQMAHAVVGSIYIVVNGTKQREHMTI